MSVDWALLERTQRLLPPSATEQYGLSCAGCGAARSTWCGCCLREMMRKARAATQSDD